MGWAEGGKVRMGFTWQGQRFEEEIYGVVEVFRAPTMTMFGQAEILVWFVDYLFAFRAAAGRLDATADLFGIMIRSFQLNPEWYAAYKAIVQSLAQHQIQRIRSIGQIGQICAQTGREMREQNLRDWYARDNDWRTTFHRIEEQYGYKDYIGNCHMVPNHGVIILGLLYGNDDFQRTLAIVNTCGWDTDCNSGNAGCLLGIKNGLAGIQAGPDWRGR